MTNQKGFTLIELLAVMLILAVVCAIAIPKYMSINETAEDRAIKMAIVDLNGREIGTWTNVKLENGNLNTDQAVYDSMDYHIRNYTWISRTPDGGKLQFRETTVKLNRRKSTLNKPGKWSLQ